MNQAPHKDDAKKGITSHIMTVNTLKQNLLHLIQLVRFKPLPSSGNDEFAGNVKARKSVYLSKLFVSTKKIKSTWQGKLFKI